MAHLIGTAIGWGGNPDSNAMYVSAYPKVNDGKTAYTLCVAERHASHNCRAPRM